MKIIAEERQPSGSGKVRRKKWRFHDQMCFIRDTLSNTSYVNFISIFIALIVMRTILFEIFHFAEQSQMKAGGNLFLKRIHQVVPKQVSIFI